MTTMTVILGEKYKSDAVRSMIGIVRQCGMIRLQRFCHECKNIVYRLCWLNKTNYAELFCRFSRKNEYCPQLCIVYCVYFVLSIVS